MLPFVLLFAAGIVPQTAVDYRQPQLAASGDSVYAVFAAQDTIYFSPSKDGGKNWLPTSKIANATKLALGNHRGPRIVAVKGGLLISAITDGAIATWRSTDDGKTWRAGPVVTDESHAADEGLFTIVSNPNGRVFSAWLDFRKPAKGKEVWGAASSDGGLTWSKNFLIYKVPDGSVCPCCNPSVLLDGQGNPTVMWRNALAGNRDMYLVHSTDGGKTFGEPEKLGTESWKLDACPMDGGGLVYGADGKMITVWRREMNIYLAPEHGAETLLHEGKNPAIASSTKGVYVAWSSSDGVFARVPGHTEPVRLDGEGGFVTLTSVPKGGVIAAWERKGTIQFHTLP